MNNAAIRKYIWLPIMLCLLLLAGCSSSAGSNVTGSTANTPSDQAATEQPEETSTNNQEGEQAEHRIVATTVAITEILNELELDVVGIPTSYKELPARYAGITEIGNPMSPDMEIIKSLKATHVLSVTTLKSDLEDTFKNLNIDASFLDFTSLDAMKAEITKLGDTFNRTEKAAQITAKFDQKLAALQDEIKEEPKPKVLILMGIPGSYLVGTELSYIGDLVEKLGGENIIPDAKVEFVASNTEYLHQSNPDIILRAAHGMPEEVVKMFDEEFKNNDIWKHFNAVKNDRVYDLEEELFGTTGNLAVDQALDELVDMLYPDRKG